MENNTQPELLALPEPTESKSTVDMRQAKQKAAILEELKRMPIVEIACKKVGVGRTTYYRFLKIDSNFAKQADEALAEGVLLMNDMAETGLLQGIKAQEFPSIAFWLKHRHKKYSPKLEVTATVEHIPGVLTPEQEKLIRQAFELATKGISYDNKSESPTESDRQNGDRSGS